MSVEGADPDRLDQIANLIDGFAGELERRRGYLSWWIEADRFWRGRRADEFRHSWESAYSSQLRHAVEFLHDQVSALHNNANQQRVASGEAPKDYGAGGFISRLFSDAENGVSRAVREEVSFVSDVVHDVVKG